MTAVAGRGLPHMGLIHDSAEQLAAAAVPFLADGLAAGDTAVLACSAEHNALLARALKGQGRTLQLPQEEIYAGQAHALATYRRLLHRQSAAGVPGVRLVGSLPVCRLPEQCSEWHRYEAVFNVAMESMPLSAVCAYDRRTTSEAMLAGVEQTHPAFLTPSGVVPNDNYLDPATVLRRTPARPLDAPPDRPPTLALTGLHDPIRLPEVRARVRGALDGTGRHRQLRGRFAAAVNEVLGNAFRHGAPPVGVRLWTTPTRLMAVVTDCGPGFDDPLAGYVPPGTSSSGAGAGLWVARQACDTLDALRTPDGFTVRLATVLPGKDPAPRPAATDARVAPSRAERARAQARELARRLDARFQPS